MRNPVYNGLRTPIIQALALQLLLSSATPLICEKSHVGEIDSGVEYTNFPAGRPKDPHEFTSLD